MALQIPEPHSLILLALEVKNEKGDLKEAYSGGTTAKSPMEAELQALYEGLHALGSLLQLAHDLPWAIYDENKQEGD